MRTKHVGNIQVEVLQRDGKKTMPVAGRSMEDCDFISGDYLEKVVTWRGNPDMGLVPGRPVSFRIKLSYGQLFSMRFK